MKRIEDVLIWQLQEIYDAERHLVDILPELSSAANSPELRVAIAGHLAETEQQLQRLELLELAGSLSRSIAGGRSRAMQAMLEEAAELVRAAPASAAADAALVVLLQRVGHYEIASYTAARGLAESLGLNELVSLLSDGLEEESAANELLADVGFSIMDEATGYQDSVKAFPDQPETTHPTPNPTP